MFSRDGNSTPEKSREERLHSLVEDASLLQDFAISSGKTVEEGFHARFSHVLHQLARRDLADPGVELETEFRKLYDRLAAAMAPVSARSIRATQEANQRRFFLPTVVAAALALFVLWSIVALQGSWVVGKRYLDRVRTLESQQQELVKKQDAIGDATGQLSLRLRHNECHRAYRYNPVEKTPKARAPSEAEKLKQAADCALARTLEDERDRQGLAFEGLTRDLERTRISMEPVMHVVRDWYDMSVAITRHVQWHILSEKSNAPPSPPYWNTLLEAEKNKVKQQMNKELARINGTASNEELSEWRGDGRLAESGPWVRPLRAAAPPSPAEAKEEEKKHKTDLVRREAMLQIAEFERRMTPVLVYRVEISLEVVQSYLQPALLGLLGALVFVLRDIGARLSSYTYLPTSIAHVFGRVVMGIMVGVLGGWFIPNSDSLAKTVPPMVIPFLLGYAVEMFFGLLERASTALSGEKRPSAP